MIVDELKKLDYAKIADIVKRVFSPEAIDGFGKTSELSAELAKQVVDLAIYLVVGNKSRSLPDKKIIEAAKLYHTMPEKPEVIEISKEETVEYKPFKRSKK